MSLGLLSLSPAASHLLPSSFPFCSYPSFQIYGEIALDEFAHDTGCVGRGPFESCETTLQAVILPTFVFIYCLLSNIVLVNLLIAMMGRTYEKVQTSAFEQWHLQVCEMCSAPTFWLSTRLFAL